MVWDFFPKILFYFDISGFLKPAPMRREFSLREPGLPEEENKICAFHDVEDGHNH